MTGFDGMMGAVHDYLQQYPGQQIPIREIARVLDMSKDQVSNAASRLRRYPRAGVTVPRRGWYRYDPITIRQQPPETPRQAPTPERAEISEDPRHQRLSLLNDASDAQAPAVGSLWEVVARDKDQFPIVDDGDGRRDYVLVRRTLLRQMQALADDRTQIQAFKKALKCLVDSVD